MEKELNFRGTPSKEKLVEKKLSKMALHTADQFFGGNKQLSIFSENKQVAVYSSNLQENKLKKGEETGEALIDKLSGYGMNLNQSQSKVLEGILKGFSEDNYKGDKVNDKSDYNNLEGFKKEGEAYKNIDAIPVLKITQAELISLSGYTKNRGDKTDVIDALDFLTTRQFCFYWLRTKTDSKGRFIKDKKGNYIKEEVTEISPILRKKSVSIAGVFKYYEIHPSAVLIDQIDNYFMLFPNDWREEVKEVIGKRVSNYTYGLFFWLRVQYERQRRFNSTHKHKKDFTIRKSWEEVAIILKMPKTMYKANKKRSVKIINDAYASAIKVGYLKKVENNGVRDILYLNEEFYPKPLKQISK